MSQPTQAPGLGSGDAVELAKVQMLQNAAAPGFFQYQRFSQEVVIVLGGWASVTLEVLSRKDFGERYLTPFRLFLGTALYLGFTSAFFFVDLIRYMSLGGDFPRGILWQLLFLFLFVGAGLIHRFEIFYRNYYTLIPWHSKSFGVAWMFHRFIGFKSSRLHLPPVDDWFIYRYAEPWAWFILGGFIVLLSTVFSTFPLGLWIVLSSLALFTKNQIIYMQEREEELNLIDAQIEAATRRAAAEGAPIEQTGGFRAVPLPRAVDINRDGMVDAEQDIMARVLGKRSSETPEGE